MQFDCITNNDSFYRTGEVYKVVVIYYVETSQFFIEDNKGLAYILRRDDSKVCRANFVPISA